MKHKWTLDELIDQKFFCFRSQLSFNTFQLRIMTTTLTRNLRTLCLANRLLTLKNRPYLLENHIYITVFEK
jgi:hypothetical protein